jgi:hypothetical protein
VDFTLVCRVLEREPWHLRVDQIVRLTCWQVAVLLDVASLPDGTQWYECGGGV